MNRPAIEQAIPHRSPMLLLDEIVEQSENHIVCRKTFEPGEFFFQGHYPDFPLVPGVILCEAGMQAGAVLVAQFVGDADRVPVATRTGEGKWKKMIRPADTVQREGKLTDRLAGGCCRDA